MSLPAKQLVSLVVAVGLASFMNAGLAKTKPLEAAPSIGAATMLADGTISLKLRAEKDSSIGDALINIKPNDPRYREILSHVGGLKPGEEKSVPPWPTLR